ncbi:MAG: threonine synthase [Planctomycetota bacterium]|jgi:threonine synthase
MTFVTHLESALDGTVLAADTLQTTHRDRPLWVRYDLDAIGRSVSRSELQPRPHTMWRYRELLPVGSGDDATVSLAETMTPLMACPRLADALGMNALWIKDESRLPTGSFKSRGMAVAVSMAKRFGVTRVAVPTAGNAGGALAAYAARAGMECFVFMPADTPAVNRYEAAVHGARVFLVDGLISDCGRIVREGTEPMGWFDLSTLKEPYRLEGKKTMGLELAEQLGWRLPDVILYPTGGGTGLVGMWKAFDELTRLGWLDREARPRMFCCQSSGCDPMVAAFEAGLEFAEPVRDPHTVAAGLRVPGAVGDFMILKAVRESGGRAMTADEARLIEWMRLACRLEGVSLCPEAASCVGVLQRAVAEGHIGPDEEVVLFNTGAIQKYVELMRVELATLDPRGPVDWERLVESPAGSRAKNTSR